MLIARIGLPTPLPVLPLRNLTPSIPQVGERTVLAGRTRIGARTQAEEELHQNDDEDNHGTTAEAGGAFLLSGRVGSAVGFVDLLDPVGELAVIVIERPRSLPGVRVRRHGGSLRASVQRFHRAYRAASRTCNHLGLDRIQSGSILCNAK